MESVEPGRERTQVKVVKLQTIYLCPFPPLHLDGEEVLSDLQSLPESTRRQSSGRASLSFLKFLSPHQIYAPPPLRCGSLFLPQGHFGLWTFLPNPKAQFSSPPQPLGLAAGQGSSLGRGEAGSPMHPGSCPAWRCPRQHIHKTNLLPTARWTHWAQPCVLLKVCVKSSFYSLGRKGICHSTKQLVGKETCSPWMGQSSSWAFKVGQEDKGQQGVVETAMGVSWWPGAAEWAVWLCLTR